MTKVKDKLPNGGRYMADWDDIAKRAITMRKDGFTYPQIAKRFGLTMEAVKKQFQRMGKAKKGKAHVPWTKAEVDYAIDMKQDGLTYDEIAAKMLKPPRTANAIARKIGIGPWPSRRRKVK